MSREVPLVGFGATKGIKIIKVWENASPGSAFAEQTIALDLSKAQWVGILQKLGVGSSGTRLQFCPVGRTITMDVIYGAVGSVGSRSATISSKGIHFLDAIYNAEKNNERIIPLEVYAIQGVVV